MHHFKCSFIPSKKQANAFFAWLLSACLLDNVVVAASLSHACLSSSLRSVPVLTLIYSSPSPPPSLSSIHFIPILPIVLPSSKESEIALPCLLFYSLSASICLLYFPFQKFLSSIHRPFIFPHFIFNFICLRYRLTYLFCFQTQQQLHHPSVPSDFHIRFDSMICLTR